ncbi:MAG: glycosyltransferase [Butyrivibrio sp.]|nr:glycosyltransferase [Butyrivibrio sp.]
MQGNSTMTVSGFRSLIRGKNVVYITVKNKDYIRTVQIKRIIREESAGYRMYTSERKNPLDRAGSLRRRIMKMDFSDADVIILGFLPQLLIPMVEKRLRATQRGAGKKPVIIAEMFLSLYDTVVLDRRLVEDGRHLASILRHLDKRAIESADLVVTDTKANAGYLAALYGADQGRFETLYLEADRSIYNVDEPKPQDIIDAISAENGRNKVGDGKTVSVLYFGTGLPLQGTDVILEAFELASGDGKRHFTFIGSLKGIPKDGVKKARMNPDIELIDWLTQKELADRIAGADLCIAGHFNTYIGKADRTIPGKAFIYDAMKKPMILGDTKANREVFKEDSRHIFVKRGNAEALAECIKRFHL